MKPYILILFTAGIYIFLLFQFQWWSIKIFKFALCSVNFLKSGFEGNFYKYRNASADTPEWRRGNDRAIQKAGEWTNFPWH